MTEYAQKFQTVIDKNTFYFYNPIFQEKYESYINSLTETLLVLKNEVETKGRWSNRQHIAVSFSSGGRKSFEHQNKFLIFE